MIGLTALLRGGFWLVNCNKMLQGLAMPPGPELLAVWPQLVLIALVIALGLSGAALIGRGMRPAGTTQRPIDGLAERVASLEGAIGRIDAEVLRLETERGALRAAWSATIETLGDLEESVERKRKRAAASASKVKNAEETDLSSASMSREEIINQGRRLRRAR